MGSIADRLAWAFRDYSLDGVVASGLNEVDKASVRAVGPVIETAIALAGLGSLLTVTKATKALLDADLAHAADVVALVYGDAADANNDIYVKVGASGAGSWTNTGGLHAIVATLLTPYVQMIGAVDSPAVGLTYEVNGAPVVSVSVNGELYAPAVQAARYWDLPGRGMIHRRDSMRDKYRRAIHYVSWMGQSLNAGDKYGGNHTLAQEYGLVAFPTRSTSPGAYAAAVATSESITGTSAYGTGYPNGESPMFGMSYIGELLEARDGVRIDQIGLKPLVCCNATGSTSIAENSKGGGTGNFAKTISQVTSAKTIAAAEGVPFVCRAVVFNQGESDDNSYTAYKTSLQQLYTDLSTDITAITGAADPFYLIINQTNSVTGTRSAVARAQFDQAQANPNIIISTPKYFLDYADIYHPTARDSKWLGAYDALAYLSTVIEGTVWQPLSFQLDQVIGNYVYLKAVGNHGPLVFDEVQIPPQTVGGMIRGFSAVDGSLASVNVTSVELAGDSRLRIGLASYSAGYKLQHAIKPGVTRKSPVGAPDYVGGAGNVRDSLGDYIPMFDGGGVRRKMHKWALAQEVQL